jgi:hypothetical protein
MDAAGSKERLARMYHRTRCHIQHQSTRCHTPEGCSLVSLTNDQ